MKVPTDLFGRTPERIRESIARAKKTLAIRAGYGSIREGYGIRTREIVANLEIDRRQLALIESGIDPKLPDENSLDGDQLRRFRNTILWLGRAR